MPCSFWRLTRNLLYALLHRWMAYWYTMAFETPVLGHGKDGHQLRSIHWTFLNYGTTRVAARPRIEPGPPSQDTNVLPNKLTPHHLWTLTPKSLILPLCYVHLPISRVWDVLFTNIAGISATCYPAWSVQTQDTLFGVHNYEVYPLTFLLTQLCTMVNAWVVYTSIKTSIPILAGWWCQNHFLIVIKEKKLTKMSLRFWYFLINSY